MNKMHFISGSLLAGLILAIGVGVAPAFAQQPDDDELKRSITVSGTGSIRVKPDLATATVGTTKTSVKLPEAKSAADAAIAQIKAAVKKAGVAEEDVQTVQYQIYRVNANPQAGIRESVWKVVHMLQVRTKKPDSIANIVDAAVAAGATDVQNIGFSIDSYAKHRSKSRELAADAAKEKAAQLASLMKVNVAEVISITEVGDYYPMAQYAANSRFDMAESGAGGSGIAGGQIEVTTSLQVVFGIR